HASGPVAAILLSHHERWDGAGYPRGLAGEEVPLEARLISVADTYDVLTARDSYRQPVSSDEAIAEPPPARPPPPQPVSSDEAIAELRRVAGHQLDPSAVEAFVRLLASKDIAFRH